MIEGTVSIPTEYFKKMAVADYANWHEALPREFYQNSIDARAKNISVHINEDGYLHVKDDGCGMTEDIILNKLLVLGGSHKLRDSVGTFGKAKELLYFSWDKWSIHTGNLLVKGSGAKYKITKTKDKIKGTHSTIYYGNSSDTWEFRDNFANIAKKMYTKTKIYVNSHLQKPASKKGKLIQSFDIGNLYLNKRGINCSYVSFTIKGIWMFDCWIGNSDSGKFTFELNSDSINLLTSNRDDLKYPHKDTVMRIIRKMLTEKVSLTKEKYTMVREYFLPPLKFEETSQLMPALSMDTLKNSIEYLNTYVKAFKKKFNSKELNISLNYPEKCAILYRQGEKTKTKTFLRQKKAGLILKIWKNIVSQVIMDNNLTISYIVGYTFDPNHSASISSNSGIYEILLNPKTIGNMKDRFVLVENLKDYAIHELAHTYTDYHDESFVMQMRKLREGTVKNFKKYVKFGKMRNTRG